MKHIDIFFHLLCLMSGIIASLLGLLLYIKYRIRAIRDFTSFVFSTTFTVTLTTLISYYSYYISVNPNNLLRVIGTFLFGVFLSFIAYSFTRFALGITRKPFGILPKIGAAVPWLSTAGAGIAAIIHHIGKTQAEYPPVMDTFLIITLGSLFFTFITYSILIFINLKKIENPDLKKALKVLAVVFIIYIPLQTVVIALQSPANIIMLSRNLLYLAINTVSIVFAAKYFFVKTPSILEKVEISGVFQSKYDITAREKEVIELLLGGLAIKQIAGKLDCSFKTVNNHIYNIYRKAGVTSKMELLNLIKETGI